MKTITITGVPEHFNYPWIKVVERQPFLDKGIELVWVNEPKGSGAMNKSLRDGSTDLAILLTESFVKDKIEGNPGKFIGFHVKSPLVWGIHTSTKSNINSANDLDQGSFVISRLGSGSHLMAFLLGQREGWKLDDLEFEIIGDLNGAIQSLEHQTDKLFLWEKYTTKPLVDKGVFKRIGEIPTPWPCFVIVANPSILEEEADTIRQIRELVYQESKDLVNNENYPELLSNYYGIAIEDIKSWLSQTKWAEDSSISKSQLTEIMEILKKLNLIVKTIEVEEFVFRPLCDLS